jgi:hypothetical protein
MLPTHVLQQALYLGVGQWVGGGDVWATDAGQVVVYGSRAWNGDVFMCSKHG